MSQNAAEAPSPDAPPDAAPGAAAPPANHEGYRWYLIAMGAWFAAFGVGFVLFPYLVTVRLNQPAAMIGIAQMSQMLPSVAFVLFGGAMADRHELRALLARYHWVAGIPPLILAGVVLADALTYPALILFGLATGTLNALATPARDSLLMRVAPADMPLQTAVSHAITVQFGAQMAGMAAAGLASLVGAAPLLVLQSAIFLAGAYAVLRMREAPPLHDHEEGLAARFRAIGEGLQAAARSPTISPVIVATTAIGLLYVGAFMVILPVFVRDAYRGGSETFAIMNVCFWSGTIVAAVLLSRLPQIRRRGLAMMSAMTFGALVLMTMHFVMPFWLFVALCFVWGAGAGVTITMGRTIVQEEAPERLRARLLSIYQLGFSGGAPIGAVSLGFLVQAVGPHDATLVPAMAMLCVLAVLALTTQMPRIEAPGR